MLDDARSWGHIIMDPCACAVRDPADLPRSPAIYDEQVRTAISTFDLEPPPLAYWEARLASTEPGHHLLVAVDRTATVVGYAYSSTYRPRPAYERTRETSVYLGAAARGRGLGRALYDDLLARLRADGMHQVLAVIALPNDGQRGAAPRLRLRAGRRAARGRAASSGAGSVGRTAAGGSTPRSGGGRSGRTGEGGQEGLRLGQADVQLRDLVTHAKARRRGRGSIVSTKPRRRRG